MGDDGLAKVVQDGSVLQAQRLHDGQDAFGEAAARFAVLAETYLPPDPCPEPRWNRTAKRSLRMVIRRLHPLKTRQGPQGRIDRQEVSTEALYGRVVTHLARLQHGAELVWHREERRL